MTSNRTTKTYIEIQSRPTKYPGRESVGDKRPQVKRTLQRKVTRHRNEEGHEAGVETAFRGVYRAGKGEEISEGQVVLNYWGKVEVLGVRVSHLGDERKVADVGPC